MPQKPVQPFFMPESAPSQMTRMSDVEISLSELDSGGIELAAEYHRKIERLRKVCFWRLREARRMAFILVRHSLAPPLDEAYFSRLLMID